MESRTHFCLQFFFCDNKYHSNIQKATLNHIHSLTQSHEFVDIIRRSTTTACLTLTFPPMAITCKLYFLDIKYHLHLPTLQSNWSLQQYEVTAFFIFMPVPYNIALPVIDIQVTRYHVHWQWLNTQFMTIRLPWIILSMCHLCAR